MYEDKMSDINVN